MKTKRNNKVRKKNKTRKNTINLNIILFGYGSLINPNPLNIQAVLVLVS